MPGLFIKLTICNVWLSKQRVLLFKLSAWVTRLYLWDCPSGFLDILSKCLDDLCGCVDSLLFIYFKIEEICKWDINFTNLGVLEKFVKFLLGGLGGGEKQFFYFWNLRKKHPNILFFFFFLNSQKNMHLFIINIFLTGFTFGIKRNKLQLVISLATG